MQSLNDVLQKQQQQLPFLKRPPKQEPDQWSPFQKAPQIEQPLIIKNPFIPQPQPQPQVKKFQSKKKSNKKTIKKSEKNKGFNTKKYPSIKKIITDNKDKHLVDLINEEDNIFNEFKTMEFNIKKLLLKPSLKYEEKINVDSDGKKERTVIKDDKKKRVRRTFTGCSVQSKITLYEKENDLDSPDDKYYEIKEIYRKCPRKNTQTTQ